MDESSSSSKRISFEVVNKIDEIVFKVMDEVDA